jgi:isoprenylcysteine carboxyl methyltransferase (ICMT) family protein YpbQ
MQHRSILSRSRLPINLINNIRNNEASRQMLAFIIIALSSLAAYPNPEHLILGTLLISLGSIIRLLASGAIIKNKILCTGGLYQLMRHPLYSGNILVLFGFIAFTNSFIWLTLLLVFLLFYYPPAIRYEDAKLSTLFGEAWSSWSKQTPALLPRRFSTVGLTKNWSIHKSLVHNGEPVIVGYILIWLYVLY